MYIRVFSMTANWLGMSSAHTTSHTSFRSSPHFSAATRSYPVASSGSVKSERVPRSLMTDRYLASVLSLTFLTLTPSEILLCMDMLGML